MNEEKRAFENSFEKNERCEKARDACYKVCRNNTSPGKERQDCADTCDTTYFTCVK